MPAGGSPGAAGTFRPIPEPATAQYEDAVREHLGEERRQLEELLARSPSARQAAEAFGRLGLVYYAYDLLEPAAACFQNARDAAPEQPRWHYYLAVIHQREGDLESGLAALEASLALAPIDGAALVRAGDTAVGLGRLDDAQGFYRRALDLDRSRAAALYGLGRIAATQKRYAEAISLFERALALQPAATAIHHQLGMALRAEGDMEAARRHFDLNTGGQVVFEDPSLQEVRGLIRSAKIFVELGVKAARAGRYEEAIVQFKKAAEADPADAVTFFHLGVTELRNGQRREAVSHLLRSVELQPDVRDVRLMLGSLMTEDGNLVEAEEHYRRAHEIDPEDLDSHLDWVTSLTRLDRGEQARAEIALVLERDAQNPRARLILGILNAPSRPDAARAELARVLDGSRADAAQRAEAWHHRALLFERAGDAAGAEAGFREAVDLTPRDPARLETLANFLGRQARFAEAAEIYGRAIAADGERSSAYFGRAMALLLSGSEIEAQAALEQGTTRLPDDRALAHLMARLLAAAADESVRDGARAHRLALSVHRTAPSPDHAETVAMALAELGRFDEAIAWQRRALAQLEGLGRPGRVAASRKRLETYGRGEPCRTPWLEPGG